MFAELLGGMIQSHGAQRANKRSLAHADYMARNQIQLRAADARAAGISPLAALGAAPYGGLALKNEMSGLGQGLSRAAQAYQSKPQRQLAQLELEHASLSNDLLRTQIAAANKRLASQSAPPVPVPDNAGPGS